MLIISLYVVVTSVIRLYGNSGNREFVVFALVLCPPFVMLIFNFFHGVLPVILFMFVCVLSIHIQTCKYVNMTSLHWTGTTKIFMHYILCYIITYYTLQFRNR